VAGFGLAELEAAVAVVDEQATFSQLIRRMGSKTRDNFMIYSLIGALGFARHIWAEASPWLNHQIILGLL
jgi:hypothetical protein